MELNQDLGHGFVGSAETHVIAVEGDVDDGHQVDEGEDAEGDAACPVDPDDLDADDATDEEENGGRDGGSIRVPELIETQLLLR